MRALSDPAPSARESASRATTTRRRGSAHVSSDGPCVRSACLLIGALGVACGAAPPPATEPAAMSACRQASDRAADAWIAVATGAEAAARPVGGEEPLVAERALDRLEEHADALSREPREVDGEEAFSLSSAMMDAIDAAGSELPVRLRERADTAAEALLTDRGRDGAARAARDAASVLEQVVQAVRPGSLEQRAQRRALEALARRARDAGDAYRDDAANGDLRADRAEAAELPPAAPAAVRRARADATDASASARRECGIERRLSVPTL